MRVYNTIQEPTEGLYKEKGSKFLSFAYPVESVDQVRGIVNELKKEHYEARHHCFAHIIDHAEQQKVRANDDGEPGHTAGDPILGQIKSFELTDVLVVVVRYSGGTKLGVPGLINAYRTAAQDALQQAEIITVEVKSKFHLEYGYEVTSEAMRIINDFQVDILDQQFTESCLLTGKIEPEKVNPLKDKLSLLGLNLIID
ncbi:IMPACT family protein [Reichenbachiella versicolor]|uniref:IMPACT family protein n=1 Tax=Reichenbachiella versicolor TaxID=1821036 RepID=UPI000D6EA0F2|nr:YigZ family protein [Reichenbachiella versicolor]